MRLGGGAPIIQPSDELPGFYSFAWDKVTCGEKSSPQHALPRPEVYLTFLDDTAGVPEETGPGNGPLPVDTVVSMVSVK